MKPIDMRKTNTNMGISWIQQVTVDYLKIDRKILKIATVDIAIIISKSTCDIFGDPPSRAPPSYLPVPSPLPHPTAQHVTLSQGLTRLAVRMPTGNPSRPATSNDRPPHSRRSRGSAGVTTRGTERLEKVTEGQVRPPRRAGRRRERQPMLQPFPYVFLPPFPWPSPTSVVL